MEKLCSRCRAVRPVDEFNNDKSRKDGKNNRCKDCCTTYRKEHRDKYPDRQLGNQIAKYGISYDEYSRVLEAQGGHCALYPKRESSGGRRLSVDHDHASGANRGILCNECNTSLKECHGRDWYLKAARYVERGGSWELVGTPSG